MDGWAKLSNTEFLELFDTFIPALIESALNQNNPGIDEALKKVITEYDKLKLLTDDDKLLFAIYKKEMEAHLTTIENLLPD